MKIAIAATLPEPVAEVAMQGARAPYYLCINTETGLLESLANPAAQTEKAAGPQAAAFLVHQGVDEVVAGEFGFRFRSELEAAGVVCIVKNGPIKEVVAQYQAPTT
ncbi:MAG: NifB/NifX family molybdenum-iron cluster-binding protein [Granulosicoccaceae bacterium]|jgi:predicted Fe-Mo cluster-binding NifX family protein